MEVIIRPTAMYTEDRAIILDILRKLASAHANRNIELSEENVKYDRPAFSIQFCRYYNDYMRGGPAILASTLLKLTVNLAIYRDFFGPCMGFIRLLHWVSVSEV
jgi:hypothetical protein